MKKLLNFIVNLACIITIIFILWIIVSFIEVNAHNGINDIGYTYSESNFFIVLMRFLDNK